MLNTAHDRRIRHLAGALLAALALAGPAAALDAPIHLTDPFLLEELGFDPRAMNIYATAQAYEELLMDPAERAALDEARESERRAARERAPAAGSFGMATPGYTAVAMHTFNPTRDDTEFNRSSGGDPGGGLACLTGPSGFVAQLDGIPHGARLRWVDFWYYDISSEDIEFVVYRSCLPDFGAGDKIITVLGSRFSSGAPGLDFGSISLGGSPPRHFDTESCTYTVRVQLDDQGGAIFCSEGFDLQLQKVRAEWTREISPAPATASFDDVPTGHLFFRHVEALAASGITSGCGGSNFCPNEPLTRGQMAAFLATALGLHWGAF